MFIWSRVPGAPYPPELFWARQNYIDIIAAQTQVFSMESFKLSRKFLLMYHLIKTDFFFFQTGCDVAWKSPIKEDATCNDHGWIKTTNHGSYYITKVIISYLYLFY